MVAKILQRDRLLELVEELLKDHSVIAPTGQEAYVRIDSAREIAIGAERPTRSLKEFFVPQRQVLLEYQLGGETRLTTPPARDETTWVVFGARPCDVAALPILDNVFAWDCRDSFYFESRERTAIVSFACENPSETCFCASLGGSPASADGADLLLTPLDDVYHVQTITERGEALVTQYAALFEDSNQQYDRERLFFEDAAQAKITREIEVEDLNQTLAFDNPAWEEITQQCIDCGICTFLCPTCHCFDIQDEGTPAWGERVRLWDACTFYNYTKTHAGQPRPNHYRRYRQRIMHKFNYYPKNFGETLCVGCGRCIVHCPVSIDLTEVLRLVSGKQATAKE